MRTPEEKNLYAKSWRLKRSADPVLAAKAREYGKLWMRARRADPVSGPILKEQARQRRLRNLEASLEKSRLWRAKNPGYFGRYRKARRANDPQFHIMCRLRIRIHHALEERSVRKSTRTAELLGCSEVEFKFHIESTFQPGMTWNNRSEWHIDHIRPCASFDLTDPEQQKQCFNYKNLQALWAKDNQRKGAKWAA